MFSERVMETASKLSELERTTSAANAAARLNGKGTKHCVDCGSTIGARRKAAVPSAKRCVDCQAGIEQTTGSAR